MPEGMDEAESRHRAVLNQEFDRTASSFDRRSRGRFDALQVPEFSRLRGGETVLEVGSGTGAFLSLFEGAASRLIGVDLTMGMLREARVHNRDIDLVLGDGRRLPVRSRSIDLVTSAQTFHHIHEPVEILKEMRRVVRDDGRILVVDQIATERFEEAVTMNELELLRDPSHVACRPPSALRVIMGAAGLKMIDERMDSTEQRFSEWMSPDEFPVDRIEAVRRFIEERGHETGMGFERDVDDYVFERRRMMLLAENV